MDALVKEKEKQITEFKATIRQLTQKNESMIREKD